MMARQVSPRRLAEMRRQQEIVAEREARPEAGEVAPVAPLAPPQEVPEAVFLDGWQVFVLIMFPLIAIIWGAALIAGGEDRDRVKGRKMIIYGVLILVFIQALPFLLLGGCILTSCMAVVSATP